MTRLRPFLFAGLVALTPLLAQTPEVPGSSSPLPLPAPPPAQVSPAVSAGSSDSSAAPLPATPPAASAEVPVAPVVKSEVAVPAGTPTSSKISYSSCSVEGPFVALTFDDGPHAQNTPRLLDLLKERKVRATFFVVGQNAMDHPELLKRTVAEGHELANHSYTHPILASLGESALRDQMEKTHQAVLKATGVTMRLMRPPYGALSETQRRFVNAQYNYRVILWDVDPLDWKFRDAGRVEREIVGHAKSGSIILAHDIHKSTVDAMASTIDALVAKGFKFVTVSELLAMDRPGSKPPKSGGSEPKSVTKEKAAASEVAANVKPKSRPTASSDKKGVSEKKVASTAEGSEGKKSGEGSSVKKSESPEDVRSKWLKLFGR